MPTDFLSAVRDILVIAYMLVVRVGVPIILTLMIGAWLKRVLEKEDEEDARGRAPTGSNVKHCWENSATEEAAQARTIAAARPDLPCWLALQLRGSGLTERCYSCPLYAPHAPAVSHT